jgi:hypothetical protein
VKYCSLKFFFVISLSLVIKNDSFKNLTTKDTKEHKGNRAH